MLAAPVLYAGELGQDGWGGMRRLLGKPVTGVALSAILALRVAGRTYLAVRQPGVRQRRWPGSNRLFGGFAQPVDEFGVGDEL